MASRSPYTDSQADILRCANHWRHQFSLVAASGDPSGRGALYADDVRAISDSLYWERNPEETAGVLETHLDRGLDFFYGTRQQLTALLRVWDAIMQEKCRWDANGPGTRALYVRNQQLAEAVLLALRIVPRRAGVRLLRANAGLSQDRLDQEHTMSRRDENRPASQDRYNRLPSSECSSGTDEIESDEDAESDEDFLPQKRRLGDIGGDNGLPYKKAKHV
jgi:hypothetical protein